jgi:hypothetical protein
MYNDENDPVWKPYVFAFTQALAGLGWSDGRNLRMDLRWPGPDINRIRALAQELVGLRPDIIVTESTEVTVAVQREARTIPIVFAGVGAPVASGMVARLDRPGGNMTGFATFEPPLGGKWLATNSLLVLGQEAVDEKSNEITAIPALLERLDVEGALVSIDAMGCNPNIAQSILDAEADYRMTQGWLLDNWHADDGITVA